MAPAPLSFKTRGRRGGIQGPGLATPPPPWGGACPSAPTSCPAPSERPPHDREAPTALPTPVPRLNRCGHWPSGTPARAPAPSPAPLLEVSLGGCAPNPLPLSLQSPPGPEVALNKQVIHKTWHWTPDETVIYQSSCWSHHITYLRFDNNILNKEKHTVGNNPPPTHTHTAPQDSPPLTTVRHTTDVARGTGRAT